MTFEFSDSKDAISTAPETDKLLILTTGCDIWMQKKMIFYYFHFEKLVVFMT